MGFRLLALVFGMSKRRVCPAALKPKAQSLRPILLILLFALDAEAQFPTARRRPPSAPSPKNINGTVTDKAGQPIAGARVFVRDMKTKVVRTLSTDAKGTYAIYALSPSVDYEVWAEHQGKASEKKYVSSFLNRADNNLNFQLEASADAAAPDVRNDEPPPEFQTYDLVRLRGSFELPVGVPAPIPAVLLLHGYGEDRAVWEPLKRQLLSKGWAVMTVDLRGHGDSKIKNSRPLEPSPSWRTSNLEFPLDLDPALDWLKSQHRVDSDKLVIIGSDVGANLALLGAGRFPQVRTVVAINPKLSEALALAGTAQEFHPRWAFILMKDADEAEKFKTYARPPFRARTANVEGGTAEWIANQEVVDGILAWLRETY